MKALTTLRRSGVTPESLVREAHDRDVSFERVATEALTKHGWGSPPLSALVTAVMLAMSDARGDRRWEDRAEGTA